MSTIHVLPKAVSELIAAGEVIERPASVVKELIENSIDAGATAITVEIQNGGVRFIRITDNGSGISADDAPTSFLRHATSKVTDASDLDCIGTLGFRGEALASITAVSKVEMMTKTATAELGTYVKICGSELQEVRETGCPSGTTITIRDIFYNVPARLKFLKKDVTEGNAVSGIVDKIALSHPEIAVKLIRDNKVTFHTPGDGKLLSAVYTIFGKEFAQNMLPVEYEYGGVRVTGLTGKPMFHRANRAMQHFFINGRYAQSRTCSVATGEAYRGAMMIGKFPACVLQLEMPFEQVDVNVHPAKIEVRFVNEKAVFDSVYFAVKSAISAHGTFQESEETTEMRFPKSQTMPEHSTNILTPFHDEKAPVKQQTMAAFFSRDEKMPTYAARDINLDIEPDLADFYKPMNVADAGSDYQVNTKKTEEMSVPAVPVKEEPHSKLEQNQNSEIRVIGELFQTYILAQIAEKFVVIDKHAAHERILYNRLKEHHQELEKQLLLGSVIVTLSRQEHETVLENLPLLAKTGFIVEDFGDTAVILRSVPAVAEAERAKEMFLDITAGLMQNKKADFPSLVEDILHRIACRAAVKANDQNSMAELSELVHVIYTDENVRYCPHGRPVMICYTKKEMEKMFGRIM